MKTRKKRKKYGLDISDDYKEKYDLLLNNMREGFALVDEDENFIFSNPISDKIFDVKEGDLKGEYLGTFGYFSDIAILREAEESSILEQELLNSLSENIPERIYFKDREENFVELSRLKALSEGLSSEEMRGKKLLKVNIDGNVCIIKESKGVCK